MLQHPAQMVERYLLFLAGFGLRQSTTGNALGIITVASVSQNLGRCCCYGLAGLLGILLSHSLHPPSLTMLYYTTYCAILQ